MRIYLAGIILFGTLAAGCSSEWDPGRDGVATASVEEGESDKAGPSAALASREAPIGFASLPDRGDLLSYSKDREVQRRGAYTSHPVAISEAHALNAIGTGALRFSTPDGQSVNVAFDHIEEHPDGNWSWMGQSETGEPAVLTFGERAVFGEIRAAGQSFRVTTRGGSAWVVETDHTLLAGTRPGHHGDGPEVLIPPSATESAMESNIGLAGAKATLAATSGVPSKAAGSVIDLALGYTNGMVTAYGSQSAAVTRLTSLVTLGNAAMQRSGVNMRLRLVRAVNVNFPDNTDNTDALQKMTGYNATTRQRVTPDAAFTALRAARDEYGADLVSLVRPHRSPEQRGCGIAWLIGANESTIVPAQDEAFGYSVVSDGADEDEGDGNTYYCSEYSLVHEIGHNLGQAHNESDSDDVGAHSYSYGYRETSTSGFHTIMAYPLPDSSQFEAPYFATPNKNYASGRPLGVAGESDNVRSLNLTMPVIGSFRATVVPIEGLRPKHDFNRDGRSDILWRQNQSVAQNFRVWLMDGTKRIKAYQYSMSGDYRIVATGDFNGDGRLDIIWRSGQSTRYRVWLGTGSGFKTSWMTAFGAGWEIAGTGDVDGDGKDDILWRQNQSVAQNFRIWLMNGDSRIRAYQYSMSTTYSLVESGDFDGDGKLDLVWRAGQSSQLRFWMSSNKTAAFEPEWGEGLGSGWRTVGNGDVDGDGKADILWRSNSASSQNFRIWFMDGAQRKLARNYNMALTYNLVTTGDFNGDGRLDLVWRTGSSSQYRFWTGTGVAFDAAWVSAFGSGWAPVAPK